MDKPNNLSKIKEIKKQKVHNSSSINQARYFTYTDVNKDKNKKEKNNQKDEKDFDELIKGLSTQEIKKIYTKYVIKNAILWGFLLINFVWVYWFGWSIVIIFIYAFMDFAFMNFLPALFLSIPAIFWVLTLRANIELSKKIKLYNKYWKQLVSVQEETTTEQAKNEKSKIARIVMPQGLVPIATIFYGFSITRILWIIYMTFLSGWHCTYSWGKIRLGTLFINIILFLFANIFFKLPQNNKIIKTLCFIIGIMVYTILTIILGNEMSKQFFIQII